MKPHSGDIFDIKQSLIQLIRNFHSVKQNFLLQLSEKSVNMLFWGALGLKTPRLGLFSDVWPKYHYVCRYSGFYGAEFKFTGHNT